MLEDLRHQCACAATIVARKKRGRTLFVTVFGPIRPSGVSEVPHSCLAIFIDRPGMQDYHANDRQLQRFSNSVWRHTFPKQHLDVPIEVLHQELDKRRSPSRDVRWHSTTRHSAPGGGFAKPPLRRVNAHSHQSAHMYVAIVNERLAPVFPVEPDCGLIKMVTRVSGLSHTFAPVGGPRRGPAARHRPPSPLLRGTCSPLSAADTPAPRS